MGVSLVGATVSTSVARGLRGSRARIDQDKRTQSGGRAAVRQRAMSPPVRMHHGDARSVVDPVAAGW
jgi:hypothetical protein